MRHAPTRAASRARLALLFLLVASVALLAAPRQSRAQAGDERFELSMHFARGIERMHAIGADTLGLSYGTSWTGGLGVDFRVLDLPLGKGRKPALHLKGGFGTDERVLGPAVPGMDFAEYPMLEMNSGVALELPLEALLKGNAGVSFRVGWDGSYLLTRSGGNDFLTVSKLRVDFVRTAGALTGSSLGFGKGRDETFGRDAASGRWDVKLALEGRLARVPAAPAPPAPAPKPGAKPAAKPAPVERARLLWIFLDMRVDTDGSVMADGLRAKIGLGLSLDGLANGLMASHK